MNLNSSFSKISKCFQKLNYNDLIIFLIPFIIFSIYLYVFNPGFLSFDSYSQMHQIATGHYGNAHPLFHTFIEMLCLKVYPSPISVAFFQIIVFSSMWMMICSYFREDVSSNRITINKLFIFQVLFTLAISLIPLNAVFSITLWKDILYSYFFMFLCFLLMVLFDRKGHVSYPFIVMISLVMAFISQVRLNGLYVIILFLIVLSAYLFKNNKSDKLYAVLPALTIIFILLFSSLNIIYDPEDTQTDFVLDKVTHMLAYYDLNNQLNQHDQEVLYKLMDKQDMKDNFDLIYKDSLRNYAVNKDVWKENKDTYFEMALHYSLKNPILCIKYLFTSVPIVWDIDNDFHKTVYSTNITDARDSFYNYNHIDRAPITYYDNASPINSGTPEYEAFNSFLQFFKTNDLLDKLFINSALCMYLSFIVMMGIYFVTKSKSIILVYLPNILNIFVIFMSTPSQYTRYLYPNFLILYLLIIAFAGYLTKYLRKNRNGESIPE